MLTLIKLLFTYFGYISILTVIRLASTAFNWEFGVSRQYLRLLELLFQLGQKRIEKVESEHKLLLPNELEPSKTSSTANNDPNEAPEGNTNAGRPSELSLGSTNRSSRKHADQPKMRRISTPDGPPVFLLDDYDDDEDDEGASAEEIRYGNTFGNQAYRSPGPFHLAAQQHEFHLIDTCRLVSRGVSAIIDDQVTKRFTPEQLKTWNLLTRTNAKNYQFMSGSLGLYWLFGVLVRYTILLPLRVVFTLAGFGWLIITMTIIGFMPAYLREKAYCRCSLMAFRMLSCGITSRLEFHNRQYRAQKGDICVANHTSPIDIVLLACDNCYALVGQRHSGLLGILEHALSRATNHVWFDRGEMRDRQQVTRRLREYVNAKPANLPVLIFPEGTCINNSAVMMFKKGSFETTDRVCPVAIKYDPRFGDPFWNSAKQSYLQYVLLMMSSWAIKCDVWYLPPMERLPGEASAEFAGRVKAEIARQGGLVDLNWDGQLKRSAAKELWKHQQQEDFARRLKLE